MLRSPMPCASTSAHDQLAWPVGHADDCSTCSVAASEYMAEAIGTEDKRRHHLNP